MIIFRNRVSANYDSVASVVLFMKWIKALKSRAHALKLKAHVLILAYSDQRTPLMAKILIWVTAGYLLSPIDLIPDFIPVIGLLDDLFIVPMLIIISIKQITKEVWHDANLKASANPQYLKKTNWIFGAVIILVWLVVIYYGVVFISTLLNGHPET